MLSGGAPTHTCSSGVAANDDGSFSAALVAVLHPYEPTHSDEIRLRPGDKIQLLSNDHRHSGGEGWCVGQEIDSGRIGVFPGSYVLPHQNRATSPVTQDQDFSMDDRFSSTCSPVCFNHDSILSEDSNAHSVSLSRTRSPGRDTIGQSILALDCQVVLINPAEIKHEQLQFIGSGAFGTVYRGTWRDEVVALKVLNLPTNQLNKEASHLRLLSHRNIVRFHGVCELGVCSSPALVMEFAHGGPLNHILADHPALSPSTLLDWALQIATGMSYLHSEVNLVHRDLKSSNILAREPLSRPYIESELCHCTLVITDFGMACQSSELVSQQSKLGTVAYAAPEVCRQTGFSFKSDVWSYGVVLWELLTLETPFRNVEQPRLLYLIAMFNYTLHIPEDVPELFKTLLKDCWSPLPASRPSFDRILPRLGCSTYCDFLTMDSAELSRIQSKWREAISAHYQEEHEAEAATLSSNVTDESQCTSSTDMDDNLSVQKELLQRSWESLDQQWQQLAARELEIDMKEEHYTRLVGTMGHQFTLLAVLAANQLKDLPTPVKRLDIPQPPPPRKRPFVRSLFRWGGITGNELVSIDQYGKSGTKNRKISTSQHNTIVANQSASSTGLNTITITPHDRSGVSRSRFTSSRGGIPDISPPVNMKHVVHVDHDWVTGHGLTDSSMRLFPAALVEHGMNISGWRSTTTPPCSPERGPNLPRHRSTGTQPYGSSENNNTISSLRDHTFPDLAADHSRLHELSPDADCVGSSSASHGSTSSNHSGSHPLVQRFYRGTPGVLRKTGQNSVHQQTGSHSPGMRSRLGPQILSDIGKAPKSRSTLADTLAVNEAREYCAYHSACNRDSPSTQRRKAAGHDYSVVSQPLDGVSLLKSNIVTAPHVASPELERADRRRSASGPTVQKLQNHCSAEDLCRLHQDGLHVSLNITTSRNLNSLSRFIFSDTSWQGNPKRLPRSVGVLRTTKKCPSSERHLSDVKNFTTPPSTCVEAALWSAFQLVSPFACLQIAPVNQPVLFGSGMAHPPPACLSGSNSQTPSASTSSCMPTFSPGPHSRSSHCSPHPTRLPCSPTHVSSEQVLRCSRCIPLLDSRRRIQSVDRYNQQVTYSCARCSHLAFRLELSDQCMLAHHAEFGDPHSPFLGMLAGSGRRPVMSGECGQRTKYSNAIRCNARCPCLLHQVPRCHYYHCCRCCTHTLVPFESRGPVCPNPSAILHECPRHPDSQPSGHSPCALGHHHSSIDTLSEGPLQYNCTCCSRFGCGTGCTINSQSRLLEMDAHTEAEIQASVFVDRNGGFANAPFSSSSQLCTEANPKSQLRVSPTRDFPCPHKACSHPSLSPTPYNPVAHSRDAYWKATQDGYLNRTPHIPHSSIPGDRNHDDFYSSDYQFPQTPRNLTGGNVLCGATHPFAAHEAKEPLISSGSSSDSDSSAECPSDARVQKDEDSLTLVPTDGWHKRDSHPPVSLYNFNPDKRSLGQTSSNGFRPCNGYKTHTPRRMLHRSPAMRSLDRPNILAFSRNRSLPDSSELRLQCSKSPNLRLPDACGSLGTAPREKTASPCGPFVSLHSTLL
ncbi:unnamed protein product [Dicrocoelium dendriticum]|nr:unnamed protein product [Dicrocoelium dendriticum]